MGLEAVLILGGRFFTWWTAALGALISVATMFFVSAAYLGAGAGSWA